MDVVTWYFNIKLAFSRFLYIFIKKEKKLKCALKMAKQWSNFN